MMVRARSFVHLPPKSILNSLLCHAEEKEATNKKQNAAPTAATLEERPRRLLFFFASVLWCQNMARSGAVQAAYLNPQKESTRVGKLVARNL